MSLETKAIIKESTEDINNQKYGSSAIIFAKINDKISENIVNAIT